MPPVLRQRKLYARNSFIWWSVLVLIASVNVKFCLSSRDLSELEQQRQVSLIKNYDKPSITTEKVLELAKEDDKDFSNKLETTNQLHHRYNIIDKYQIFRKHVEKDNVVRQRQTQPRVTEETSNIQKATAAVSPVILVPGYGGSRLEGRRNKTHVVHYFCEKHSTWSNFWLDLKLMLPYMIDCLIDDFRLEFDQSTNKTHNTEGIDIRVREPDNLDSVEYLNDIHLSSFGYFASIIRKLTHTYGYERDVTLRGAPYDFRKAPNELDEYFRHMKEMVETMFAYQNKRVTFVCHSMGCNNLLYFLQQQPQQWKHIHVRRIISLAAPWGGSMQALRATAFGDNLGLPYLFDEADLKIVQQSVPSTMYLFPNERVFSNVPLITTNVKQRTKELHEGDDMNHLNDVTKEEDKSEVIKADDYKLFFEKINHPNGYLMWLNTKDLLSSLKAPGVEVWCLYGTGHQTLGRMEFEADFPNSTEHDLYDDGDGTVTVQSSSFCENWSSEQEQLVHTKAFVASHVDMMKDAGVLSTIEQIMNRDD